jgi:hypothetical protein
MNAKYPITFLVWWLHFKAEVRNKLWFADSWSPTSTCSAQHHASVMSILTQVIQDNQAKTKLTRFVSSDDPHRGRRDVEGLLAAFLPSPMFRSAILNHAMLLALASRGLVLIYKVDICHPST